MTYIYHLTTAAAWEAAQAVGVYRAASLDDEGFVHCSTAEQVVPVANSFYRDTSGLLLLAINAADLGDSLVFYEAPADAADTFAAQQFPHVYGPIPVASVNAVHPMPSSSDGAFTWPPDMPRT